MKIVKNLASSHALPFRMCYTRPSASEQLVPLPLTGRDPKRTASQKISNEDDLGGCISRCSLPGREAGNIEEELNGARG